MLLATKAFYLNYRVLPWILEARVFWWTRSHHHNSPIFLVSPTDLYKFSWNFWSEASTTQPTHSLAGKVYTLSPAALPHDVLRFFLCSFNVFGHSTKRQPAMTKSTGWEIQPTDNTEQSVQKYLMWNSWDKHHKIYNTYAVICSTSTWTSPRSFIICWNGTTQKTCMKPSLFPASQMASKTAHPLLAEAVVASGTCSSARRFCVSANCSKSCDRFCRTSSGRSCGWHIRTNLQKRGCCNNFQVGMFWNAKDQTDQTQLFARGKSAGQETRNFVAGHKSRFITLPCSRISILAFQQSFQASFRVEVWWFSVKRGQLGSCLDNDKDSIKMLIQLCQQQS